MQWKTHPEVRQLESELTRVIRSLAERTSLLEESWRAVSIVDRFLATSRLVQSHRLHHAHARTLSDLNATAQRIWTDLRQHKKYARDAHDQIRIFALQEELARVERDRDSFMDEEGLVEDLFCVAETFLMERRRPGETFADLTLRRERIEKRLESANRPSMVTPEQAEDAFTTQKMAVVYSLTGDIHSAAA